MKGSKKDLQSTEELSDLERKSHFGFVFVLFFSVS